MHYDFDIEIPALTTKANKLEYECKLSYGILRKVWIYFRGGCADLVHIKIFHGERQIFPSNPDGDFAFNDYVVIFEEYYPILEIPYTFKIFGWNDDDTFAHTITCSFLVLLPSTVGKPELRPTEEEELQNLLRELQSAGG